jgi:hypothetical protein
MIKGYCDPKFQNVYDAFSNAITSGFETGAALAIEHQGKNNYQSLGWISRF